MQYRLNIKAFFFNAETDYLPYYKHFEITLDNDAKAVDMLARIKEENENFSYPEEHLVFKINAMVVEGDQSMDEVVARLGTELQIDPVNTYRANNGLIINDDDFMQRYALLAPYASEKDLSYYQTLYALHYASETEKFDHDYIGDAILLLADKLIQQGTEHQEAILHAISDTYSGLFACEYENNLFNAEEHSSTIEALKEMVKPSHKEAVTLIDKITQKLFQQHPTEKITGKGIAYYMGHSEADSEAIAEKAATLGAHMVPFSRARKRLGLSLLGYRKRLAFQKAGTTLLDALDHGAEILVVEDPETCRILKENLTLIAQTMGRDIPLTLIDSKTFLQHTETIAA